jgi:6-phosphogluconolactonase
MKVSPANVEVCESPVAVMEAAAEAFVEIAARAVRISGRFAVALSGGSTPKSLYRLLAADPYASRVSWPRAHVFWGDERCVPPGDPRSNYQMVREVLLDRVPLPADNIHRIQGEDDPAAAAVAYERLLRALFSTPQGPPRLEPGARFDLVLLGMGDNGHTASLFPGLAAVRETERWVVAEYVTEVSMWRVTMTPVVINAAAEVLFLATGGEKAPMLRKVLQGPHQPEVLPAQIVVPRVGRLRWLVDAAAAADLNRS